MKSHVMLDLYVNAKSILTCSTACAYDNYYWIKRMEYLFR